MKGVMMILTVVIAVLILILWYTIVQFWIPAEERMIRGHWEVMTAIEHDFVIGYQVRWSIPNEQGRYLWVGHYYAGADSSDGPSLGWCQVAAGNHAERWNQKGKLPFELNSGGTSVPMWINEKTQKTIPTS